jgi:hypothetical protein
MEIAEDAIAMDTCRNCQHWTHFMMAWENQFTGTVGENAATREDANYGHCLLTENTDYGFDGSALAKVGITDGILITSAEFGCNQFQSLSDRYAQALQT